MKTTVLWRYRPHGCTGMDAGLLTTTKSSVIVIILISSAVTGTSCLKLELFLSSICILKGSCHRNQSCFHITSLFSQHLPVDNVGQQVVVPQLVVSLHLLIVDSQGPGIDTASLGDKHDKWIEPGIVCKCLGYINMTTSVFVNVWICVRKVYNYCAEMFTLFRLKENVSFRVIYFEKHSFFFYLN